CQHLYRRHSHYCLEPFPRFNTFSDYIFFSHLCGKVQIFQTPVALLLLLLVGDQPSFSDSRVNGAAKNRTSHFCSNPDTIVNVLKTLFTIIGIVARYVARCAEGTTDGDTETCEIGRASCREGAEVSGVA